MCLNLLACLCPPIAVCFRKGCGLDFCVTILLTIAGWLPGCCYACIIVNREKERGITVTQVTNVQAAPQATSPQVNINIPQYHQAPIHNPHYPSLPMNPQYPYPPPNNGPPPAYASAPPYYGQGDNNMDKC